MALRFTLFTRQNGISVPVRMVVRGLGRAFLALFCPSGAFGFGQPLRPNLMFIVGFFGLAVESRPRPMVAIRTLHVQIRRSRDHLLHVGFLSPPVSAQCPTELQLPSECTASVLRVFCTAFYLPLLQHVLYLQPSSTARSQDPRRGHRPRPDRASALNTESVPRFTHVFIHYAAFN